MRLHECMHISADLALTQEHFAAGYLSMIDQMKELVTGAGKKAYTLAMGRPNPAKLANFPEVSSLPSLPFHQGKRKTRIFLPSIPVSSSCSVTKLKFCGQCDVFIYVSCAQTALLDSKEFLSPVITPFEAMLAFKRYSTSSESNALTCSILLTEMLQLVRLNKKEEKKCFY